MTPEGFEPAVPPSEAPQTHALDGPATGIGVLNYRNRKYTDGYIPMVTNTLGAQNRNFVTIGKCGVVRCSLPVWRIPECYQVTAVGCTTLQSVCSSCL